MPRSEWTEAVMKFLKLNEDFEKVETECHLERIESVASVEKSISGKWKIQKFRKSDKITQGGFGKIFKTSRVTGDFKEEVYVKKTDISCVNEIAILSRLNHENITELLDLRFETNQICIFMRPGILDAHQLVCQLKIIPDDPVLSKWLNQMESALAYIHSRGVIHSDVKPGNMIIFSDFEIVSEILKQCISEIEKSDLSKSGILRTFRLRKIAKLCLYFCDLKIADFGMASFIYDRKVLWKGYTFPYKSPEVLACNPWTESADIWALGCSFYEISTGKVLFSKNESKMTYDKMHSEFFDCYDLFDENFKLKDSDFEICPIPEIIRIRIAACLMKNPDSRFITTKFEDNWIIDFDYCPDGSDVNIDTSIQIFKASQISNSLFSNSLSYHIYRSHLPILKRNEPKIFKDITLKMYIEACDRLSRAIMSTGPFTSKDVVMRKMVVDLKSNLLPNLV